ncbi:tetratricopeptide repeat protein, partial [Streptomyces sp. NPDC054961]
MTSFWPWNKRKEPPANEGGSDSHAGGGIVGDAGARPAPEWSSRSGSVAAAENATAAGRDISYSALGAHSSVTHIHLASMSVEVSWPQLVGVPPALASSFQRRPALRTAIDDAQCAGEDVVLAQVLSGGGGVGKSQLAAAYAYDARLGGTDLVLWVPAADIRQVIALYARAAQLVHAPGALGREPEVDARAFLEWLATTSRSWLVVLDDVTDPAALAPWWPVANPQKGWVLATSRLKDGRLTGQGRRKVDIDVYSLAEAVAYLEHRLTADALGRLLDGSQEELAQELGCLPLALGHAVAHLIDQQMACADYLVLLRDRERSLDEMLPTWADTENYGRQVTAALLLSRSTAEAASPRGLALPVLQLTAFLDSAGHPQAIWKSEPVLTYLAELVNAEGGASRPVVGEEIRESLLVLHRYALINYNSDRRGREVRIHALTARAVQETTPEALKPRLARTAAHALFDVWTGDPNLDREVDAILRANAAALAQHSNLHLWEDKSHRLLYRAGSSMVASGLFHTALLFLQELLSLAEEDLGPEDTDTIRARAILASTHNEVGQYDEARALEEQVLADRIRLLGDDHGDTHVARACLARTYGHLGRHSDALELEERVLGRVLGSAGGQPLGEVAGDAVVVGLDGHVVF